MFTIRSEKPARAQSQPLNETQRALVEKKRGELQLHSRPPLAHSSGGPESWTDECVDELRRRIASTAPSHLKTALIDFRKLGCVSFQCLPLQMPTDVAR